MKPKKHIDALARYAKTHVHPARNGQNELIDKVTKAVLFFTSTDNRVPEADTSLRRTLGIEETRALDLFDDLYKQLDDDFYNKLYVDVYLAKEVSAALGFDGTVFITGYAGSGKSTLLRKLRRDRPSTPSESLTLVDVAMTPSAFRDVTTCYEALCEYIYRNLFDEVARHLSKGLPEQFALFRIRQCASHSQLREKAQRYTFLRTDEEWRDAITPALLDEEHDLWHSGRLTHFERLSAFLDFLRFLRHRTIIIFDNVDRLPIPIHEVIGALAEDLGKGTGPLAHPVVSVRENNYRRLMVRSSHELTFRLGIEALAPEVFAKQELDANAICSYTTKRLTYTLQYVKDLADKNKPAGFVHGSSYEMPAERAILDFEYLVLILDDMELLYDIHRFHNGSFRCTSIDIYRMVTSVFGDPCPGNVERREINGLVEQPGQKRALRTLLYRHMIMDYPLGREMKVADIFEIDDSSHDASAPLLRLIPLKILLYLRHRLSWLHTSEQHEQPLSTVGDVLHDFAYFGVNAQRIEKVMAKLAIPRSDENYGLIYIDVPMQDLPALRVERVRQAGVYILPAGAFVLETLGVSCEYIFWLAMCSPLRRKLWDKLEDEKAASYVSDDSFRAYVALRFLCEHVAPQIKDEVDGIIKKSQEEGVVAGLDLTERYKKIFGIRAADRTYSENVVRAIEAFVDNPATNSSLIGDGFVDSAKMQARRMKRMNEEAKAALFRPV